MDYEIETKFTVIKQARQVKPESHTFLNLRHNSEHVDHVISRTSRPQENMILRFLEIHKKNHCLSKSKIFCEILLIEAKKVFLNAILTKEMNNANLFLLGTRYCENFETRGHRRN